MTKVALVGANGQVGKYVLSALVEADFQVLVLSRSTSTATFSADVQVAKVDFDSESQLRRALTGQRALVSTLGNDGIASQRNIFAAAIAVGVERIIPSEFGADSTAPENQSNPVFANKIGIQEYLRSTTEGTGTTYTLLITGMFLDWSVRNNFFMDIPKRRITLYDGGEVLTSTTTLPAVGKAVASVLQHLRQTSNRAVKVHSAVVSQRKLLMLAKNVIGAEGWTVVEASTYDEEILARESLEQDPSNISGWFLQYLRRAVLATEKNPKFDQDDADMLGLPRTSDAEIEQYITEALLDWNLH